MKFQHRLKTVRKGVAVFFAILIGFSFIDFYGIMTPDFLDGILMSQFGPVLVKALFTGGTVLVALLVLLGLTLLFGRIYCSFLCPLGIFTDALYRISGQKRIGYTKPHTLLRYALLAGTALSIALGSLIALNLLDPFSVFGRMVTGIARPLAATLNNLIGYGLERFGLYWLTPVDVSFISLTMFGVALTYLLVIAVLAVTRGRLYCNSICPVGTLLGLMSRFAVFRVAIDPDTCVSCGKCERICKAGCVDAGQYRVDVSRCVACFNCIPTCPENSVQMMFMGKPALSDTHVDGGKRLLMVLFLSALAFPQKALAQVAKPLVFVKNTIPVKRKHPSTPPGSISVGHFTQSCTACYVCVSHCPGKVIQPHPAAYGTSGLFMPRMDNAKGFCNFTCNICGEVCPTGAITPLSLPEKQQVQIGVVRFIRENCIVITQKTECGACSEHCPTKAVDMVVEGGLRVPKVNPDICVGCGACEYACPSLPHKSIYVEGNPVHKKAEKPVSVQEKTVLPSDDFPF